MPLCKALVQEAQPAAGPTRSAPSSTRKVRLQGDLERLVKHAGRHHGAGLEAIRAIPTEFV